MYQRIRATTVPEHDTDGRLGLVAQEVEERGHGVTDHIGARRNVHRAPDVDGTVAVPGKIEGLDETRGHPGREQLPEPGPVVFFQGYSKVVLTMGMAFRVRLALAIQKSLW